MSAENKIIVHHYVDVGVNFPYYVLARTNLRISPFAGRDKAYAEIHKRYGEFDVDWDSVPRIGDVWWDWLWRVGFNGPYESVQQTIAHIHSEGGDAESIAAQQEFRTPTVEKLIFVAKSLMPYYVQHWKEIQAEVNAVVQSLLESFPTKEILKKNEEILHRTYEPAEAFFYYNFFRTTTAQSRPWDHSDKLLYIVGLDYLRDAKGFAGFMAHELRHILINQSGVFGREDILASIQSIHSLTKDWKDSSEVGCVIENMNFVLDAWYENGIDFDFSAFSRMYSRSGRREEDRIIAKAFYDNRQILTDDSFEKFVEASLQQLKEFGNN
jgi:hypothetical protein